MGTITRIGKALAGHASNPTKTLSQGHPPLASDPWWIRGPAGYIDTRGVGDGSANSAVVACLQVIADGLAEPPLKVWERDLVGAAEPIPNHPLVDLWERPNSHMTSDMIMWYLTWATHIDGNGYIVKVRNPFGEVIELWPLIPTLVEPKISADGNFIDYYEYVVNGKINRIPVTDMMHLRIGMDPNNHRLGYAPLKSVLREVLGDEVAGQFATALMKNMGVPGVILSPDEPGDPGPSEEQADRIMDRFNTKFGGDKRGEPMVLTGRMKVSVVSFSPQQMDLRNLRRLPEERVTAVLGVPAIMANLGAGLDRSTFANMDEAGEHLAERKLVPIWRKWERQLQNDLGTEFELADNEYVAFDIRQVKALQEELNNLWLRVDRSVRSGWITVADARRVVGLITGPNDEVYLRPLTSVAIPAGADIQTITSTQDQLLELQTGDPQ